MYRYERCPACGKKTKPSFGNTVVGVYHYRCENCSSVYKIDYSGSPLIYYSLACAFIIFALSTLVSKYFMLFSVVALLIPYMIRNYCPRLRKFKDGDIQGLSGGEMIYENLMLSAFKIIKPDSLNVNKAQIFLLTSDFDEHDAFTETSPIFIISKNRNTCFCTFLYDHPNNNECLKAERFCIYENSSNYEVKLSDLSVL